MAAKRIYEAAREMDLTSKALIQLLRELGFEVKSHMSVFTDDMAARVEQRLSKEKEAVKEEEKKKEEIKRAVKEEEAKTQKPKKKKKRRRRKKKRKGRDYAAEMRRLEEERRKKREELLKSITKEKVSEAVRKTLAQLSATKKKKRYKQKGERTEEIERDPNVIDIHEFITTQELAKRLDVQPADLIERCFNELGVMITLNQRLDFDTISLIVESYGKKAEKIETEEQLVEEEEEEEDESQLVSRPPVVTVMGHVDHGKTTLLDYIRRTNVVAGEMGGITQHIGAYTVETEYGEITFIDTPGHRAFTAMRARGAQVTDIVVLVVDWKDGVMPQTEEAINHARSAGVPIIVAINKMDLPGASADKVMQQLSDLGIVCDQWGGDALCVDISAKTGMNVETLIEYIILQAEVMELRANPFKPARGIVLEAELERGRGPIATVLVQRGTLRKGDAVVMGVYSGRVRNMFDERGNVLDEVPPGRPARVIGMDGVPEAGDQFFVVESDKQAAEIAMQKRSIREQQERYRIQHSTLSDFYKQMEESKKKVLRIVLKGDVGGSVEAISDMLTYLFSEECKIDVIHKAVGQITENDILLASASKAIVIGFNVKPDRRARETAIREGVEIRLYDVIYDLEADMRKALEGMLSPQIHEEFLGNGEILQIFKMSQVGQIAGCVVNEGVFRQGAKVYVRRNGELVGEGKITSLRRFKQQVKEVIAGLECGVQIEGVSDFAEGDEIECVEVIEIKQTI
ncbi:translation initiation factor IF-2 [bacterium]|nr:translation initiation factor IF-2 [bacterium]